MMPKPIDQTKKGTKGVWSVNVSDDDEMYVGYPPLLQPFASVLTSSASLRLSRPLSLLCANRGYIISCPPLPHWKQKGRIETGHPAQPILYSTEAHVLEVFGFPYNPVTVGPGKRHHNRVRIHVLHLSGIPYSIFNLATRPTFFPHTNTQTVDSSSSSGNSYYGPCGTIVLPDLGEEDSDKSA